MGEFSNIDSPSQWIDTVAVDQPYRDVPSEVLEQLYRPIAPWQIRLLRIAPSADFQSDLTCDLLTADLIPFPGVGLVQESTIVQYEALSYSWGYPALTKSIACNGLRLPVSDTMYEALRHIRRKDKIRYLWTDACCINQRNLHEKSKQVEMMFVIFQKAMRVVAWLGTPSPEEEILFHLVSRTDEYDQVDQHVYSLSSPPNNKRYHHDHYDHNLALAREAAMRMVTSRAFFRRTWIRQEFFAAQEMDIVCGKHVFSFPRLSNVLDQLLPEYATSPSRFIHDPDPASRALLCYSYFRSDYESQQMHQTREANSIWFYTIMRSAIYQSTLPQDKIFAVLGIVTALTNQEANAKMDVEQWDATKGLPPIDYTKPMSLVFQDFIKHTVNGSNNLKCLSIFENRGASGKDLPSWTIDLRVDVPRYLVPEQMAYWGRDFVEELRKTTLDFDQHNVLPLHGRRIGTIGAPDSQKATCFPWSEDYPREVIGLASPMLESCLSAEESWFPEADNRDSEGQLAQALARLQTQCAYLWKAMDCKSSVIMPLDGTHVPELRSRPKSERYHYAFVSDLVNHGDILVHLNGASLPFVLRDAGKGTFSFLGPAILAVGVFKHGGGRGTRAEASPLFRYAIAGVDKLERHRVEEFVLV
ncbi:uncharacterized protein Z518_03353 [Rhinocladiella mackenziei CBS 650.93]|uniref:Heterokaryon incompatibility domain-containing protein n=1 Tax=Rhinocladiella mackenziei CBS 650.93 TaxID=1442369 RepID=A0A0D2IZ61_9EURO|nr:uncharacterized protein Z518_03353 [Rhinocladiella mackenziei CBS 650.93]KIX08696.1 hypothetical protein Z518_03353 [Rhinocladiella mackenziei CBS 650.93]